MSGCFSFQCHDFSFCYVKALSSGVLLSSQSGLCPSLCHGISFNCVTALPVKRDDHAFQVSQSGFAFRFRFGMAACFSVS